MAALAFGNFHVLSDFSQQRVWHVGGLVSEGYAGPHCPVCALDRLCSYAWVHESYSDDDLRCKSRANRARRCMRR